MQSSRDKSPRTRGREILELDVRAARAGLYGVEPVAQIRLYDPIVLHRPPGTQTPLTAGSKEDRQDDGFLFPLKTWQND